MVFLSIATLPGVFCAKTTPLLSMATSNLAPSALYSSMAAATTATMITRAPTTNQFLPIARAFAAR